MNEHRRDPRRAELKREVRSYLAAVRGLGRAPNRVVRFEGVTRSAWLVDDPMAHPHTRRYLLLDDGDAWCETVIVSTEGSRHDTYEWLPEPTAGLRYALRYSLEDARAGGDGFLVQHGADEAIYLVDDRRARPRTQEAAPTDAPGAPERAPTESP